MQLTRDLFAIAKFLSVLVTFSIFFSFRSRAILCWLVAGCYFSSAC